MCISVVGGEYKAHLIGRSSGPMKSEQRLMNELLI